MHLNDYQAAALRSANCDGGFSHRLAVAGMGLAGEAAETLDLAFRPEPPKLDKLIKELGDVMWYTAETATLASLKLGEIPIAAPTAHRELLPLAIHLTVQAGLLTDYLKKVVGHKHQLDTERVKGCLGVLLGAVRDISLNSATSMDVVCERNVAKLLERYPTGFTSERSVNRVSEG